jgi:hypothetical protein
MDALVASVFVLKLVGALLFPQLLRYCVTRFGGPLISAHSQNCRLRYVTNIL